MSKLISLNLNLEVRDSDADAIDRMTRSLRAELDELGIDARLPAPAAIVPGAKGEAITLGVLALAVLPELAPKVIEFLQGWLGRGAGRTLRVEVTRGDHSVKLELPVGTASLDVAMAHVEQALGRPERVKDRRG